ncbi:MULTISPECIES: c-type cytochrome [unclassified Nitratiruptor]|uniref:c-type cytochrome n=1 Tax=unclassified Nitratiruptor TaxID=2624044 RepID=UPI001915C484|nr:MULTISPECIES: c-type cytochrome [unclassified Nitratiruptor]BCD60883.1 cytochrome c [Nitratiruptor sp. YY08-10]BCD64815.1 cytochrome c [Nitratiruptor sp. YY08-14]
MKKITLVSIVAATLLLVGCSGKKEEQKHEAVAQHTEHNKEIKKAEPVQQTQKSEPVKQQVQAPVKKEEPKQANSISAKDLFGKCASCHGTDGKRKALGKSGIIAGMSKDEVLKKLKEYKSGTLNKYGMGPLMKAQVAGLSDKELEALAEYIASMK